MRGLKKSSSDNSCKTHVTLVSHVLVRRSRRRENKIFILSSLRRRNFLLREREQNQKQKNKKLNFKEDLVFFRTQIQTKSLTVRTDETSRWNWKTDVTIICPFCNCKWIAIWSSTRDWHTSYQTQSVNGFLPGFQSFFFQQNSSMQIGKVISIVESLGNVILEKTFAVRGRANASAHSHWS